MQIRIEIDCRIGIERRIIRLTNVERLADLDNPLYRVNRIHALLKVFLNAHNSFDREKLQGYLDLFTFAMNPPANNLEKVEILLNLAFHTPKSLKYRDLYHVNQ